MVKTVRKQTHRTPKTRRLEGGPHAGRNRRPVAPAPALLDAPKLAEGSREPSLNILVVGYGEVGSAHVEILKGGGFNVKALDIPSVRIPGDMQAPVGSKDFQPHVMFVAIRHSEIFDDLVENYAEAWRPDLVSVLSTVPPLTCERLEQRLALPVTHSTTRGLHPNLVESLRAIPKHVSGNGVEEVSGIFRRCGLEVVSHIRARTTEVAHILNNVAYGVNLVLADEMAKVCRDYGVDYYDAVMRYTGTNNVGYDRLGHHTKRRMVLTPPNGNIGGHCIRMSANLIKNRPPLIDILARYGK